MGKSAMAGGNNVTRISILLKVIYRFNLISTKIHITFFSDLEKQMLKLTWKYKRHGIAKAILNNNNTRLQGMQKNWCWHKNRYEDQWKITEIPETNLNIGSQLIFDKKTIINSKIKDSFSNKWCWEHWVYTCNKTP